MHRTVALGLALTIALGSALWLAPAVGRAQAQAPAPPTTTVGLWLYPGWNFVGWLGEDGPADVLFGLADASTSEVAAVRAPAPAHPTAETVTWEPLERGSGRMIRTGEPMWIRIAGESLVRWQQDALLDPPVSPLGAGRHAVVWSWAGDRPIGAVLGRVAGQLVYAHRWNSRTQEFERYPGDSFIFSVLRGEALYLQLDAPSVWGPALGGPTITGADWLPAADRRTVEQAVAGVHRYFDRWLGITPLPFQVHTQEFPFPCLTAAGTYRAILYLPCLHIPLDQLAGSTMAESYATTAVPVVRERGGHTEPEWLVAGHAHYVYARWMAAAGLRPYRSSYSEMIGFTRATDLALDSAPLQPRFSSSRKYTIVDPERPLWEPSRREFQRWIGALAIDWLVQWTGEAALEQYAHTRFAGDWRAAFQDAFGMSVDQFLYWFEYWRARVAPADGGAPRLSRPFHHVVFSGPLTDERRALVATIEEIVDFFEREYGLTATAATFLLDIDVANYKRVSTVGLPCGKADRSLIYLVEGCTFPFAIAHEFVHVLQDELDWHRSAPLPRWLVEGAAEYLAMQQSLDVGRVEPGTAWTIREESAAGVIATAPAAASDAEVAIAAIDGDEYYQVYSLAVRHLVERFGIDPLFAAFGPAWSEAGPDDAGRFQAVFGASLDDFYASFGRWLRSLD